VTGARSGALLINLGTPKSPSISDVRRYLREFLSDPRVIDSGPLARRLLVELLILPFRPRRSARAYAKVWTPHGSPLLVHSQALSRQVDERLGPSWVVELAMRYGQPSIGDALARLTAANVERIVVLPLFPQYSEAATGSALAKLKEEIERSATSLPVSTIRDFYDAPAFVDAVAGVSREALSGFDADFVLFSYHGLPERQVRAADPGTRCLALDDCCASLHEANRHCYRAQCFATTRALVTALALAPETYSTAFQSRLGRTPWIQPFTDRVLPQLAQRGVRRVAVVCPSFPADCLETLEEIGIRAAEQWRGLGGEALVAVPAPNSRPGWVRGVADLLAQAGGASLR
jgi:ferrochelatase